MVGDSVVQSGPRCPAGRTRSAPAGTSCGGHRPAAAEVRVLVAQRVQRVRVGGDDAVESAASSVRDVLLGERLPQPFLARRGGRRCRCCARRRRGSRSRRRRRCRAGRSRARLLGARVEGGVVADEPEHVDRLLAGVGDLEVQLAPSTCRGGACSRRTSCRTSARSAGVDCSSAGSSPSSTARRRSWLMIGACSMPTGHASTQALHCMHDQIVSRTRRRTGLRPAPAAPIGQDAADGRSPGAHRCSRRSRTTSRGDSGLPGRVRGADVVAAAAARAASSWIRCSGRKSPSVA